MPKAIVLLSGGLDSTLAAIIMRKLGVEVTCVQFMMHFGCDMSDTSSCSTDGSSNAARYGYEVKLSHLADKFTEIVKNPKYGHGRNMNPCIDCRILMLKEAKVLMQMMKADFLVTGEVLGQRPMSQRKETFPLIDREAGVKGLVLRPLCAKFMPPTDAELKGLVDRDKLYNFSGRSRKPQMALAAEFGLTDYPNPAGGCLLTEPIFAHKLRELLSYTPDPTLKELTLLKLGRHFRLPGGIKFVVGRDHKENERIMALADDSDYLLRADCVGSPLTLIPTSADDEDLAEAAAFTARYSDAKKSPQVDVHIMHKGETVKRVRVAPAQDATLDQIRIHSV